MRNKRKIINWFLLIAWMIVIFIMSNQPAQISDSQSEGILNILSVIGINMSGIFGQLANFVIRKCAHFLEYMVLCLLAFNVFKLYFNTRRVIFMTIVFVFFYACSDEIHQLFVLGREGAFRDVIIDTFGGVTLILINIFVTHLKSSALQNKDLTKLK